jgi:Flp pilus assembly protein TadD
MRHVLVLMTAISWAGLAPVRGQLPEDRYMQIYSQLEEADKLKNAGNSRGAVAKYLEVQNSLKGLQRAFPDWNSKLVGFRLEYVASQLEPLAKLKTSPLDLPAPAAAPPSVADQVKLLQEETDRLTGQNSLLEARLREALKVQPAAIDPRELANAEEKIKQLQKERDLLNVTLKQSSERAGTGATEAKQNLVTQSAVLNLLQKQNEDLQKQISELTARLKASTKPGVADNAALRETVAALEASNRVMKEEQMAMENRLKEFVRQHGTAASKRQAELEQQLAEARAAAKNAEKERDELIVKLNAVSRELNARDPQAPTPATQELERQLEAIRAKLQIFQARQVPYTEEELALFKQTPLKVATPTPQTHATNASMAAKAPVSAAATTLLTEADQAIEAGRMADAENRVRQVLSQEPTNVFLMAKLAAVQMDQDKKADAETTLKRALELDPQNATALYLLGNVELLQERYDEAFDALSLSAKIEPGRAQTHYFLGKVLIQKGSRGPAEAALRKAVQLKPGWGEAHYLLAVLYATQEPGFKELARYHYKQAIAGGAARNYELEKVMDRAARQ